MAAHRWSKPTKRKRRIDPRYFLEETATRGEEIEEGYREDEREVSDPWSYERGGPGSKRHPRGGYGEESEEDARIRRHGKAAERRKQKQYDANKRGTWGDGIEPEEILEEEEETATRELEERSGFNEPITRDQLKQIVLEVMSELRKESD